MKENTVKDKNALMIEMRGVTKTFPGIIANEDVDFDVRRGEVHALLGENGAGKSTLMNVLYGLYAPDKGEIFKEGLPLSLQSPADAISKKIGMIHQHFMLIPTLSVVENVALCLKGQNPLNLNLKSIAKRISELSKLYGLEIDPWANVAQLSVGAQQRVEILKVLYRGVDLLIMDEPTAVLTPNEVTELFKVLRDIVKAGNSVIFISHKLWEVMMISNRITVLRDGRKISTVDAGDVIKESLASMMVGREVFLQYEHPQVAQGEEVLRLEDVHANDDKGIEALQGMSFSIHGGEILGIAGVDGNGQKEIAEVIHGMRRTTGGKIRFHGKDITNHSPKEIISMGLGHVPEDRHARGVVLDFSVSENIALIDYEKEPYTHRGIYRPREVKKATEGLQKTFDIRCASIDNAIRDLSGGNQQKVVLAREISREPDLLIAAQPSRGLDIGATEYTQKLLIKERTKGMAILLISTDLDEVLAVSDRVLVLYEGRIMGEFRPGEATFEEIGLMMAGSPRE